MIYDKEKQKACKLRAYRSLKGVLTTSYNAHRWRSKKYGWNKPDYTKEYLHKKFLTDKKYLKLHKEWVESGYNKLKKPSIDRIDNTKPYSIDNIQLMTWKENNDKGRKEYIRTANTNVEMYNLDGAFLKKFDSVKEAVEETGLNSANLILCCQGKRNHCGGFSWKYGKKVRCKSKLHIYNKKERG